MENDQVVMANSPKSSSGGISELFSYLASSFDLAVAISLANLLIVAIAAYIAIQNLRKFRNSRAIDFVISAEGQIDTLVYGMMTASPHTIRKVFGSRLPEGTRDEDLPAFVYSYSSYAHISRMFYLTNKAGLDLGMSKSDIQEWEDIWLRFIGKQKDNDLWLGLHRQAVEGRYFNDAFLDKASKALDFDQSKPESGERDATSEV
ncbi:hypothetical protein GLP43_14995 [Sulfitobacter sp. M39]|uniref:hypothetical protein n=1 Tax=Sulfitobacter sp. M39 TaxID=2675334 RepID=UPI001F17BE90|nr:hypothetical protein [Sulfitobacter sp. M39]MCF7748871.1 hypothetical protein [Sulfitobacter sp. M39]